MRADFVIIAIIIIGSLFHVLNNCKHHENFGGMTRRHNTIVDKVKGIIQTHKTLIANFF
jgi:hypothetical protein